MTVLQLSIEIMEPTNLHPDPKSNVLSNSTPTSDTEDSVLVKLSDHGLVQTPDGLVLRLGGTETPISKHFSVRNIVAENGISEGFALITEASPGQRLVHPISYADAFSQTKLKARLATLGILRSTKSKAAEAVLDYIFSVAPLQPVRLVHTEGIVKLDSERFITVFEGEVTAGDGHDVLVMRPQNGVFSRGGTEHGQQTLMRKAMDGNPLIIVVTALGLACALAQIVDFSLLSLFVNGPSTTSKSTVGRFLVSLYGRSKHLITWDATKNGLEAQGLRHTGVPLVLDELGAGTFSTAQESIYILSGSMSRSRMTPSGAVQQGQPVHVGIYGTGEVSPKEHAQAHGGGMKVGHEARMITITLQSGETMINTVPDGFEGQKQFADYIAAESATHYGHFMPTFMTSLAENAGDLRIEFSSLRSQVEAQIRESHAIPDLVQVEARVFDGFVNMGVAASLAVRYHALPIAASAAFGALGQVFLRWLGDYRDVPERDDLHVRGWLRQNLRLFDDLGNWREPKGVAGFILPHATEGVLYLVHKKYFCEVVCKGIDAIEQLRCLRDSGFLATHSHNLIWGQRMPGAGVDGGVMPFYAIREAALYGLGA